MEKNYEYFKQLSLNLFDQHYETVKYYYEHKIGYQEIIRVFDLLPNMGTYFYSSSPDLVILDIKGMYSNISDLKYILFGNNKQMRRILPHQFFGKDFGRWEYMDLDFVILDDNIEPHLIVYKYEDGIPKLKYVKNLER